MLYHCKTLYICLEFQQRRRSTGERPAHAAIIERSMPKRHAVDDTCAVRVHRKEEAKSNTATTEMRFPKGETIWVTDSKSPFASFGGSAQWVTRSGKIKAPIEIFRRITAVEFDPAQLSPAA